MNFDDYQKEAMKTAQYGVGNSLVYPALGLAGEAGEVANKVKKILRDDGGILTEKVRLSISGELGDVLWYLAAIANDLGITLDVIAQDNIIKLHDRNARGVISGNGDNR